MTYFIALQHFNPLLNLLIGLVSCLAYASLGLLVLRALRIRIESAPMQLAVALLLTLQCLGVGAFMLSYFSLSTAALWRGIWMGTVVLGVFGWRGLWSTLSSFPRPDIRSKRDLALYAPAIVAVVAIVLTMLAPSSKIDELHYHLFVPQRLLEDPTLTFYRMPWIATVWPQLIYQASHVPLFALGYPDAASVVSFVLAVLLGFVGLAFLQNSDQRFSRQASYWLACSFIGLYPAVWIVTGGSHSFGDLSVFVLASSLWFGRTALQKMSASQRVFVLSLLAVFIVSAKFSLVVLGGALLVFAIAFNVTLSELKQQFAKIFFAAVLPWLFLYLPVCAVTYVKSGSPFGFMLSNIFPNPHFSAEEYRAISLATQESNQQLREFALRFVTGYQPFLWLLLVLGLVLPTVHRKVKLVFGALLLLQIAVIALQLPYDPRFLGGLHLAIVVAALSWHGSRLNDKRFVVLFQLASLGWVGLQIYYSKQFFAVGLGLQRTQDFLHSHVPLFQVFDELDARLPNEAVIYVEEFSPPSVHFPRRVIYDVLDFPTNKPAYYLKTGALDAANSSAPKGMCLGAKVLEREGVPTTVFRTPGRQPTLKPVSVYELKKCD